ncbi:MAG: hypothetical protein NWF09_07700 [Candidatus Bathyarchaeota archaeon]|nr:hypothetical protein [Candidatus Bathyarchaeota archaeon]
MWSNWVHIKIPRNELYQPAIDEIKSKGLPVEYDEKTWTVSTPTTMVIFQPSLMSRGCFRNFYRDMKVERGKKILIEDEEMGMVRVEPNRTKTFTFRLAESEIEILKSAAENAIVEPTVWARNIILERAAKHVFGDNYKIIF